MKPEGTQQFGANCAVENLDCFKVKTESLSSTESIFMKCYVKDICKHILNQNVNFAKNSYPQLQHLNLDYSFICQLILLLDQTIIETSSKMK